MKKRGSDEQVFSDLLDGMSPEEASPQLEQLAKMASALRTDQQGPGPQFKARLRSQLLAQASETPEDVFAAALDGMLLDAPPADLRALVMVASALEPAELAHPSPAFRYQLRAKLIAQASMPDTVGARLGEKVTSLNDRMRRSFRSVLATGMAAAVLAGSGAAVAASSRALPGDALYGLKGLRESAQLVTVSGADEGDRLLGYASTRLSEVKTLIDRQETSQSLYVSTLGAMDSLTNRGSTILIADFKANDALSSLERLTRFTQVQAQDLSRIIDQLPAAAQPAARDSLILLERVDIRAQEALNGCPCSSNPLVPVIPSAGEGPSPGAEGPECACNRGSSRSTSGSTSDGGTDSTDDGTNPDDGGTDPQPPPPEDPNTVNVPEVDGTDADNTAEDALNDLIDQVTESPLPLTSVLPTPSELPSLLP